MISKSAAFIGIDGGGTKTTAVVVDAGGLEIARAQADTSNPSVIGIDAASQVLVDLIAEVRAQVGVNASLTKGWAGLSGFGRQSDHDVLRPILQPSVPDLRLTNDVEIVLAGLPNSIGVALISGTGSIVAGRNESGEFVRVGGWGHVMGDEGSGYDIGRQALAAISRQIDGRGPESSITKLIFDDLGITEPYDLITKVYDKSMDKAGIARFAKFPLDQAYLGDAVSIQIVEDAAKSMAVMVSTAARRLGFTNHLPLALTGGIMLHYLIIRERVISLLREERESVEPMMVLDPALAAARSLAGFWGTAQ